MGVELVEASDLVVRDGLCYMRTTRGLARVDSIYRRIDDDFMDPLEFRPDSLLGVPGLMGAYRAGNVAIANAVGTGVADDKAIYHYVPEMIRFYLGEEPILDNLPTWLLADPEQRAYALEHMHELVIKPTGESGGKGVFIGPHATEEQLADERGSSSRRRSAGSPSRPWRSRPSRPRCRTARSRPARGPAAVRVYGDEIKIVPGGLTRVALREGSMIVNSSQGGGSKDTWVLGGRPAPRRAGRGVAGAAGAPGHAPGRLARPGAATAAGERRALMLARIAHDLYWLGRHLVRAEHTARMLDGLFHADLQGRADDPASVTLSWERCWRSWARARSPARPPRRRRAPAHDRRRQPGLDRLVRQRRARGGAHAARHDLGRDVGVGQHVRAAAGAARPRRRPAHRPLLDLRARQGAQRAVLGPDRAHDAEGRGARVPAVAGGRIEAADMVLRMLRVALPRCRARRRGRPRRRAATATRWRCCARSAASRPSCGSAAAPPNAGPVARFMLYEREFPDSVAASVQSLDARSSASRRDPRDSPPVLRVRRMLADLDFRARGRAGPRPVALRCGRSSRSWSASTTRSTTATSSPAPSSRRPSPHEIRPPLPRRVPLRRAGLRPAQRAAREAGDDAAPARARLPRGRRAERAHAHLQPTTSAPR